MNFSAHSSCNLRKCSELGPVGVSDISFRHLKDILNMSLIPRSIKCKQFGSSLMQKNSSTLIIKIYPELCSRAEKHTHKKTHLQNHTDPFTANQKGSIHFPRGEARLTNHRVGLTDAALVQPRTRERAEWDIRHGGPGFGSCISVSLLWTPAAVVKRPREARAAESPPSHKPSALTCFTTTHCVAQREIRAQEPRRGCICIPL